MTPSWTPLASTPFKKRITNCKFATHSLDSPFSMNKKPLLARPPLASTPFKKRNTQMFAAHAPLTRPWLVKVWQCGQKPLVLACVAILFFLMFSYFFWVCSANPSYFFLFFLFFLIFSYFAQPIHLIFSYFFLFFLLFLILLSQPILFFLISFFLQIFYQIINRRKNKNK
jgi:hypothetical protein